MSTRPPSPYSLQTLTFLLKEFISLQIKLSRTTKSRIVIVPSSLTTRVSLQLWNHSNITKPPFFLIRPCDSDGDVRCGQHHFLSPPSQLSLLACLEETHTILTMKSLLRHISSIMRPERSIVMLIPGKLCRSENLGFSCCPYSLVLYLPSIVTVIRVVISDRQSKRNPLEHTTHVP